MDGERLARATQALDAVYCLVSGVLLITFAGPLGRLLRMPDLLVVVAGAATAGWALVVLGQAVRIDWRRGVAQTLAVNATAALSLALAAALHPAQGARTLLAFVALDVTAFAVAQAVSLMRRGRRRSS